MMSVDRYECAYCGQRFCVPSIARDHEAKHEEEADR